MEVFLFVFAMLVAVGIYLIAIAVLKVPYRKASQAVVSITKKRKKSPSPPVFLLKLKSSDKGVKKRREAIEAELPRFVMNIEQGLKSSRDILSMLETYKCNVGEEFRKELEITTADMKSGSFEAALTRLETRVGSTMLSDVVRGLISVLRGDNGVMYFQILAHEFKIIELQRLKLIAMKRPSKIRKYSFAMLGCFVFMYLTVMAAEVIKSLGTSF